MKTMVRRSIVGSYIGLVLAIFITQSVNYFAVYQFTLEDAREPVQTPLVLGYLAWLAVFVPTATVFGLLGFLNNQARYGHLAVLGVAICLFISFVPYRIVEVAVEPLVSFEDRSSAGGIVPEAFGWASYVVFLLWGLVAIASLIFAARRDREQRLPLQRRR